MRRRTGAMAIAASPVLVGVATTLVVVVAVFLAYNANAGLPWVPTYDLTAEVPNALNLVENNEVRIGGSRVGVVDKITPVRKQDGSVAARLHFKLETSVKPLPVDSTLIVRPRSTLGLKYVELTRGTSSQGFKEGERIPLASAKPKPVEFDDFFNTFDRQTRKGVRRNLRGFGDAFTRRGADLNVAIEELVPLVRLAEPVFAGLVKRRTRLERLFPSLARAAEIVAPVAVAQAEVWANLDITLAAFADVARPFLQDTISKSPAAMDTATEVLPRLNPFLRKSERFFANLQPGARALRNSAPDLAVGFEAGSSAFAEMPGLNRRLGKFLAATQDFAEDPLVPIAFADLIDTVEILDPLLAFVTPAQTTCNYLALWVRNVASMLSEGDSKGSMIRFVVMTSPQGPNSEGGPSSAPANGPAVENYLHANPYPNTAAPGQTKECEAGNEPYAAGQQVIGNVPGNQGTETADQK